VTVLSNALEAKRLGLLHELVPRVTAFAAAIPAAIANLPRIAIERYGVSSIPADSSLADWPLSYADLEPFYDRIESEIGVSGKAGNLQGRKIDGGNVFEAPRKPPWVSSAMGKSRTPRTNGGPKPHSRRRCGRHDFSVRCPDGSGICRFRPGLLSLSLRLLVECKEPDSRPSCHRPTRRDKGHRPSREYSVPMIRASRCTGNDDGNGQVRRVWRVRVPDHSYSIIGEQMPLRS
jgi:choline dehydrogenase-like flavoprotein